MYNFNYLQKYGYAVLMAGYSVFLMGDAGTGKTTLLNKFIHDQRERGRNVLVCAPTGIAALHINGVTIHHQFKANIQPNVGNKPYNEIVYQLSEVDTLVIDEISICRVDLFDYVVKYIFAANSIRKYANKPKIQVVLSGDFLQLPPVITEVDREILNKYYGHDIGMGFAFQSEFWDTLDLHTVVLTEIVRQENKEFMQILSKLRLGDKTVVDYVMQNCSKVPIDDAINLYGKNDSAMQRNIDELNKIPSELYTHEAIITGGAKITDTNAEMTLAIKVGARVMTLTNKEAEDGTLIYGNGSLGTVVAINSDSVTVEFDEGFIENIGLYEWNVEEYYIDSSTGTNKFMSRSIGTVVQYPLKLAYAVTIHKAQGQTYDAVNINPYAWDCGQLYVALSRVKDIKRLYLTSEINYDYIVVSLSVIKFYNSIIKDANKTLDTTVDLTACKPLKFEDKDLNSVLDIMKNIGGK